MRAGGARRVLFLVQNLSVPQDRRVWREARSLSGAGYDVSVICPRGPGEATREVLDGVRIRRFPAPPTRPGPVGLLLESIWTLGCSIALALLAMRDGRFHVVHAANPPDTFFVIGLMLRPFGTHYVYDQHDLCPELLDVRIGRGDGHLVMRRVLEWLETRSYRTARLVIVPNASYRAVALGRGGVPPERAIVVRSGADEARARPPRERKGPLVVAFAGVMGPQDRVDVLLHAAAFVLALRPGALRLDLIGRGDDVERLQGLVRELGLESSVCWAGWLSGTEVADRLTAADVAVSLDGDDEFSRMSTMTKVPEYLALGLPCVISDLPENRVTAGDAVRYFAPGDPGALAHQLLALLDTPGAGTELARKAQARAPWLLWERSGTRLVAAYRWMFGEGPPVPGPQPLPDDSPIAAK